MLALFCSGFTASTFPYLSIHPARMGVEFVQPFLNHRPDFIFKITENPCPVSVFGLGVFA